ncbi:MAG TPA: DPP IV N-terminal domain-containing protein, partial [Blastocatellia bacterium]
MKTYRLNRKTLSVFIVAFLLSASLCLASTGQPNSFTLEQVLGYPYPLELAASPTGSRIAWVFDEKGVRNIWAAEGPDFKPHRVTDYKDDDGQELTNISLSSDGSVITYVRGGDHDSNFPAAGNLQPDPSSSPSQPKLEVLVAPFSGGPAKSLGEGDAPLISPHGDRVVFIRDHQVWSAPLDGSKPAARAFFCRGESTSPSWSPDGNQIAFVSMREDHSLIAVYRSDKEPIQYLAPTTSLDSSPVWSPDGTRIAFVRQPGRGGAPETILDPHPQPWAMWVADVHTGDAREVWKSPATLLGSVPQTLGGPNLHWGSGNRLVFLSDLDGWPHLYSISEQGGQPLLLTPGKFMAEYVTMTPDAKYVVYNANAGPDGDDIDRRHIFRVPVDSASPQLVTAGAGIEWSPVVTGDGATIAFIGTGAQRPPLPGVVPLLGGAKRALAEDQIPADFPASKLLFPKKVVVRADDGVEVHCQLFERPDLSG